MWIPGPVPPRFWEDRAHRRDYLLWLAQRFGFRTHGGSLSARTDGILPPELRRGAERVLGPIGARSGPRLFPGVRLEAMALPGGSEGFWDSPANRRSYMDWLGERLGYRCKDDWYVVAQPRLPAEQGQGAHRRSYHGSAVAGRDRLDPRAKVVRVEVPQVPDGVLGTWRRTGIATCAGWERSWGFAGRKTGIGFSPRISQAGMDGRLLKKYSSLLRPDARVPAPTRLGSARQTPPDPGRGGAGMG